MFYRFIRSVGAVDTVSARKFLEAAKKSEDTMLFYAVFKVFEQRNIRLRGSPKFAPGIKINIFIILSCFFILNMFFLKTSLNTTLGEHCDPYVKYFEVTFGKEALAVIAVQQT